MLIDADTKSVVAAARRGPAVTVGLQYFLSKIFCYKQIKIQVVIEPYTFWDWVPGSWCGADRSILYFLLLYFLFSLSLLGYVITSRWQTKKKGKQPPSNTHTSTYYTRYGIQRSRFIFNVQIFFIHHIFFS